MPHHIDEGKTPAVGGGGFPHLDVVARVEPSPLTPDKAGRQAPLFTVVLRPSPGCDDPIRALRALLKRALRSYGLRCVGLRQSGGGA